MARALTAAIMLLSMTTAHAAAADGSGAPDDTEMVVGASVEASEPITEPTPEPEYFGPERDARAWCVEGIESHHGMYMYNPIPVGRYREHAQGYLGWLPSTAQSVGATIGNRASEWRAFRRMLAAGRGSEFYGISARIC